MFFCCVLIRRISLKSYRSKKERGTGGGGIAACMLGFSLVYFTFYFVLNWIYETKEERRFGPHGHNQEELRVISKEEVMKRGIGQHVFKCYAMLGNYCRGTELYKDTVDVNDEIPHSEKN